MQYTPRYSKKALIYLARLNVEWWPWVERNGQLIIDIDIATNREIHIDLFAQIIGLIHSNHPSHWHRQIYYDTKLVAKKQ